MKLLRQDTPIFDNYGGCYHLRLSTVEDLKHLLTLDDGRWMATSCPLFGVNVDGAFLKFLDADGNGRIISDEVRAAVRWSLERLHRSETWTTRQAHLPLCLMNTDHPDGKALEKAACCLLENLKLNDAQEITLEQVQNCQKIMAQARYNGDGVIPPEVIEDPQAAQFARDLIATFGGVPDASGLNGVNEAFLDQFKKEASAYLQWHAQGIIPEGETTTDIMPFGAVTPAMFQAVAAIRDKVEQFFIQCALIRFDPRTAERMRLQDEELAKFDYSNPEAIRERLRIAPLAAPTAEGVLTLAEGVNELYREAVNALQTQVIVPMFGEEATTLTEAQWREILAKFASYEKWVKAKPVTALEPLGVDKLRTYLEASHDAALHALIASDKAAATEIQQLQNLEKLILYHQWLFEFVNNYVSLPRLFDVGQRAMFEMGTLILWGREFTFSVKVENRRVHAELAKNSSMYLLYLQITGAKPEDNFEIAVPVTGGDGRSFYVGQRGVFFTVTGRELDAQIVQIVLNPISFWELMKEPFRRFADLITARLDQLTTTIQKEAETSIGKAGSSVEASIQTGLRQAPQTAAQRAAQPPTATPVPVPVATPEPTRAEGTRPSGTVRDLMIGTGFLVAGLGTALKLLSDMAEKLKDKTTLFMLLKIIGVFLGVISVITAINAWRKVRRRDVGVLLQASGWAINRRMRLTAPMARLFARNIRLPKDARKGRKDLLVPLERMARQLQSMR